MATAATLALLEHVEVAGTRVEAFPSAAVGPGMRRYVDWLIDRGVHGLYPNGSTGEFTRFTVEERRRQKLAALHHAGRALNNLEADMLAEMAPAERTEVLRHNIRQFIQQLLQDRKSVV